MKTLIIYNEIEFIKFVIVDGDYSRFNGICANSTKHQYDDEFLEFFFDDNGQFTHELSENINLIEDKNWDKVALVTFLP